ncbi:MAG: cell division protein FtsB [Nevskiales bacterium]
MFRLLVLGLLLLLLGMQYRLWVGDGGWAEVARLRADIEALQEANADLQTRNNKLEAEISSLKTGVDAMEERARSDLGMVKEDEDFFLIIEPEEGKAPANKPSTPAAEKESGQDPGNKSRSGKP